MTERSDNMYDFRKFNDDLWTLPKPWSDPGSVAGFPGIAVMVKSILNDETQRGRLDELKASHFDTLFGRNPVNAASANKGGEAYPRLGSRLAQVKYGDNICARLELCRGVLNTIAAHEHYPFNPNAKFRHPEGWTGFNAAFNASLAYCCWDECTIEVAGKSDGESLSRSTSQSTCACAPPATTMDLIRRASPSQSPLMASRLSPSRSPTTTKPQAASTARPRYRRWASSRGKTSNCPTALDFFGRRWNFPATPIVQAGGSKNRAPL